MERILDPSRLLPATVQPERLDGARDLAIDPATNTLDSTAVFLVDERTGHYIGRLSTAMAAAVIASLEFHEAAEHATIAARALQRELIPIAETWPRRDDNARTGRYAVVPASFRRKPPC